MNRKRVEAITTPLAVVLLVALVVLLVTAMADSIFDWDLFSGFVERLAWFGVSMLSTCFAGTALISSMVNLSRIADDLERRQASGSARAPKVES